MPYAKSETTRRRLITTTIDSLRANGYSGTGLSGVIERSGVPRGSVYHHFPGGKADLAASAIRYGGSAMVDRLREMHARSGSVARGIEQFCDYYRDSLEATGFVAGCPIATVALEGPSLEPQVREEAGSALASLVAFLAEALAADGVTPRRATRFAPVIVSAIEGAIMLAKATGELTHLSITRDWLIESIEKELQ